MKERDRARFRDLLQASLRAGHTLTEAIAQAYADLLRSSRDVYGA